MHYVQDRPLQLVEFISWLRESFEITSYSEAVAKIQAGDIDRPVLAISFDDGLKAHARAAQVLANEGVSACFFVCPGIVEMEPDEQAVLCRERLFLCPQSFVDWDDIDEMLALGHEIGSHSMLHFDLASIPPSQAAEEIRRSAEILRDRLGRLEHFAWPYGRREHMTPELLDSARIAGVQSCASSIPGCMTRRMYSAAGPGMCLMRQSVECDWSRHRMRGLFSRGVSRSFVGHATCRLTQHDS